MIHEKHEKHDEIVAAIGLDTLTECVRELLECVTGGDLFDCAAGDLVEARGYAIPHMHGEPTDESKQAYDLAFFHVVGVVVDEMRRTWGGYYDTFKV